LSIDGNLQTIVRSGLCGAIRHISGDKPMYIVFYWDAYGDPHQTERMTKEQADIVVATMTIFDQDPYLVYVR